MAERRINLSRLKAGTRVLLETTEGVWCFRIVDPALCLIEVEGTDHRFQHQAKLGRFLKSMEPTKDGSEANGELVECWVFSVQFADVVFISEPVLTASIEGDDWKYDVF